MPLPRSLLGSLLFALATSSVGVLGACYGGSALADQVVEVPHGQPLTAIAIAPPKARAPYDVQVLRANGESAPTFAKHDRFYVQGNAGERYVIRVTNPTPNRVEAVVTVDGLDVIDGEPGDLRKRGYVVPPYGETRIEGFRTSTADVATFRFSAVGDSYAALKGKARNVGVIAVAIFEEQAPEPRQEIVAEDRATRRDRSPDAPVTRAPADAGRAGGGAPAKRMPRPHAEESVADLDLAPPPPAMRRSHRPGLGTEFGEQRTSAVSYTRFVRAVQRPIAIAELRYNNHAGLVALGIHAQPLPDERELMLRETADPFPGDHTFSRPPR